MERGEKFSDSEDVVRAKGRFFLPIGRIKSNLQGYIQTCFNFNNDLLRLIFEGVKDMFVNQFA